MRGALGKQRLAFLIMNDYRDGVLNGLFHTVLIIAALSTLILIWRQTEEHANLRVPTSVNNLGWG